MRRILLLLLAAVLMLSAVEWETEQVTEVDSWYSRYPVLALDSEGNPRILLFQYNMSDTVRVIKLAFKDKDAWHYTEVAHVMQSFGEDFYYYSLDLDSEGNNYVVYTNIGLSGNADIFLATDSSGEFSTIQITDDSSIESRPLIKLDNNDNPHILFDIAWLLIPRPELILYLGKIDEHGFQVDSITDDRLGGLYFPYLYSRDLVLSGNGDPHVLYIDSSFNVWHAEPPLITQSAWDKEQINETPILEVFADIDDLDFLHLAFNEDYEKIYYLNNTSGTWETEIILEDEEPIHMHPSLALDNLGEPHIAWNRTDTTFYNDVWFVNKLGNSWVKDAVTSTPEIDEWVIEGHFLAVDPFGFGHTTWWAFDPISEKEQIYYAKTKEPLSPTSVITGEPDVSSNIKIRNGNIQFNLVQRSTVHLGLFDALGRRVCCIASGIYAAGEHSIPINSDGLPSGVYFVHLESTNQQTSVKFVLTR